MLMYGRGEQFRDAQGLVCVIGGTGLYHFIQHTSDGVGVAIAIRSGEDLESCVKVFHVVFG